ncbi:MAG TPA: ABC transporter substrate-binding protein [Candidatus Sulfotelmatobacter sp.]|nr:ABC transporter substrate-binding protein [Candidatus Sulfotelmatobacter sp.]
MKLFDWRWLAVSSVLAVTLMARAEARPQYGGTLHVTTRAALTSLDPADSSQSASFAQENILRLIFETLVSIDDAGRIHPGLAIGWKPAANERRWHFQLRRGVKFQDGTLLTPEIAAASLRAANPAWTVSADSDGLVVERDVADPELPAELALPRNAIARRNSGAAPIGTGPFRIGEWQAGKKLVLAAEEDYWSGRPYLDSIEIEMGRSFRDQMTELELARADLVEVAPEQAHRASLDGRKLVISEPVELVGLVFAQDAKTPEEKSLREALALSIDRASIRNVLLQGAGQPAGALLPNWMSGYEFVFPTDSDLARARRDRDQSRNVPAWKLGYDANDSLAKFLSERIALNARDAGLQLQPAAGATGDLRLVRASYTSPDPWLALAGLATLGGVATTKSAGSVEDLYASEQALLNTRRIIPLFHLPVVYAAAPTLKGWTLRADGSWNLADAWLGAR